MPFRPGEESVYQVYATFDDITDQFLTFKALQEHESRLNAILENTTDAIVSVNRDYIVTAANESAIKMSSMVVGPIAVGRHVYEFIPAEYRSSWENIFKQVLGGQSLVFESHYDTDKGPLDIEFSASPINSPSGEITGISFFGRNITERRQAEQELKDSEERYRTLIENAGEAIYVVQKGRIVFARSGPSPITGFTGDELIGKRLSELIYPDDYAGLMAEYQSRQNSDDRLPKKYVYRTIAKSGEIRWVEAHATEITWQGKPAVYTFQTDITERRQQEEAIKKTNRLYKMLYECNEAVVQAATEQQLLQNICNVMVETGGYLMVWIGFAENDDRKTVRPMAHCGLSEPYIESINITWADDERGRGPTGKALRSGNTVINQDVSTDPDFAPWLEEAKIEGYAASAALPLKSYWQTIGALNVYSTATDAFDQDEVSLLEQLAADLAYGITSMRERKQREQAEEALRENEQRFRKALQSTTDIVRDWNIDSGQVDWFGDIDGMLGYGQTEFPRTLEAWEHQLHPDDHDRVIEALSRHAQTGEPYNIEYRIRRRDGAIRYWIDRGLVLRDRAGNIVRSVGACVDITKPRLEDTRARIRRDLAITLASTTDLNSALQQSLDAAIKIAGMESGVIYLLDDESGDFKSVYYQNVSSPTIKIFSVLKANSEDTLLLAKGTPIYVKASQFTPRYETPFKSEGWTFTATLPVMHEGKAVACFIVCSHQLAELPGTISNSLETIAADISGAIERIRSRQALQASEERYRFITDHTRDVIWVLDKELHYTYVSPSITLQRGYTVDEAMALNLSQVATLESLDKAVNTVLGNIPGNTSNTYEGTYTSTVELELYRKDGTTFWAEESTTVLITSEGQFAGMIGVTRDITERRKLEAELREREAMFRVVFEHHYQFTGLLDPEGRMLAVNNTALQFAEVSEKDVLGKYFWETPWWQHSAEIQQQLKAAIGRAANGEFIHYDTSNINARGEIRQVDFTLNPVLDNAGKVIYMVPEGRDITDVVKTQKALKESEEKYRNVIEVTYDTIAVAQEGILKFFNGRAVELTGYSADELLGMPFINLVYPEDRDVVAGRYARRLEGKQSESAYALRYITKDGRVGWAEINIALIEWEGKSATLSSLRDITERKRAEDALRESEERYRKLTESTVDIIATVDLDLVLTYVNNAVRQILGYDPKEVVGLPLSEVVTPSSYNALVNNFKEALSKMLPPGSTSETHEIEFIKKDGSTIWTEGKMRFLRDANLNPIGVIGVIRDISERMLAAEALRKSEEKYRQLVETANEVMIVIQDLKIKFSNRRAVDLTRYSSDELKDMPFANLVYPDDLAMVADGHRRRLQGEPFEHVYPFRYVLKGGAVGWAEINTALINWEGRPATLSFISDITERKQAEDALHDSEEKYRAVVENAREGIIVLQGEYVKFVNQYIPVLLGYSKDFVLSHPFLDYIHPDDRQAVIERYMRRLSGEPIIEELTARLMASNGSYVWAEIRAVVIEWEGKPATLNFVTDITESKKTQAALLESMERFQRITDNAPDLIFRVQLKPDIKFEYVSPASTKIIGYTPDEHYKDYSVITKIVYPDDLSIIEKMIESIRKGPEAWALFENPVTMRWIHKDGHIVYIEAVLVPIYNKDNKAVAFEGIARDITDRKKAESELNKALETVTSTLEGTMEAVAMMSELRDPYTAGHQKMVTQLALAIAKEMQLSEDRQRALRVAGLLHDVGKVYVPSEILSKPGKLSELERGLAKAHASAGYDIVKAIKFPWPVDEMVHQHHERMDGSGYPRGLKGDQIMLEARILAVSDTVEAMMSHRPYRAALGMDKALDEIIQNRGTLYDETVVDTCVSLFKEKGFKFPV